MAHPIVHTEIQVRDGKSAVKWYAEVFGWDTAYTEELKYGTFKAGEHGGGFSTTDQATGTWPYIGVDDIPGKLKQIAGAGGKVMMEETPIPGIGAFGVFGDPDGNVVGLFKESTPPQATEDKAIPNPLVHIEFSVTDPQKAIAWYRDLFNWNTSYDEKLSYGMFSTGEGELGGGFAQRPDGPSGIVPYMAVEDVDGMTAKAKQHGAKVVQEPFDIPTVGRMSLVSDPDGNVLGLINMPGDSN